MYLVVGIFMLGIFTGILLRKKPFVYKYSGKLVGIIVFLLLFSLGISVGRNQDLTGDIAGIGLRSLLIAVFAMAGSILLGMVYKWIVRKNEK